LKRSYLISCLAAVSILSACGGSNNSASDNASAGPRLLSTTSITGVGAGTNFGFDIGTVAGNRYYLTDRNNAAVDVFDTATSNLLTQIKGSGASAFAGSNKTNGAVDNSISGPNGVYMVGNLLYVGDVNSVKIVDPATQQVIKTITVGTSGKRADEGCVDAAHNLFIIATPEADTPYLTVINTATQAVVGTITFTDADGAASAGLEACQYDVAGDTVYINNDGTTANPHGEFVAMTGASIRAIPKGGMVNYTALPGVRTYSEGNCDPTGLAFGPGNEVAVGCREATTGAPLLVQIMDRTNGRIIASVNAGGGDEIAYDESTNRYYNAASRWTASGNASTNGTCSAASPCTPVLAIIDAATHAVVTKLPSGNNAHSVAVDPATGKVFMPTSSGTSPAGCATCSNEPAGLLTFASK
jgi:YVTN family beta-propeller protein